ncbi:MAG: PAS domain S-box protein [Candidatus Acidiferrales bacterium]
MSIERKEESVARLLEIVTRSQRNYRELIDNLDHAVFTLDGDGVLCVVNRYMSDLLGVPFSQLVGRRLDEFLESPSPERSRRGLAHLLIEGVWSGRVPVKIMNSEDVKFFDCRFVVRPGAEDGLSINGWARDVTAQHESESRFTELFGALREGIFFTTPEGRLIDANPALVRMLGYSSKEELQVFNFREVYADPATRDALVLELQTKGSMQDRELVLRCKDGTRLHCLASGFAIRDSFGRATRLQGTLVDVTDRLDMERQLRQEQEFVRRLIASFPDLIAVFDREGRFTYVSPRVEEILGSPPQEYIGSSLGDRTHPEDRPRVVEMLHELLVGGMARGAAEFRTRTAEGNWRILRASAGPIFDADGKINGVVASARDVTDTKQFEQQLQQREKLAAMGQMMAGAAHELNNPLTAILGVSDLLRERSTDDAMRRQIEIVLKQARRAATIVQDLLAFSRPAATGREKVRIEGIVQRALEAEKERLREKNIRVEFDSAKGLPGIEGDVKLLQQVFQNLIVNAEQAISSTRTEGALRVSVSRSGAKLSIAIADDGPGIPPDILVKIFDPFFSTKRPGGGTGLGLTICLAIAKEHGGTIEAESVVGSGTTVRVLLPLGLGEAESVQASLAHASRAAADSPESLGDVEIAAQPKLVTSALAGHSALIVDDEESIREVVQEGLLSRGMRVEGAASSEEALAHLAERSFEIVVCDFNLPGLSGTQLFEKLCSTAGARVPRFVFMTGDMLDPAAVAALGQKGAFVLQKPFHVAGLAALLTELIEAQQAGARS